MTAPVPDSALVSEKLHELEVLLFSKYSRLPLGDDKCKIQDALAKLRDAASAFGDGNLHDLGKKAVMVDDDGEHMFRDVLSRVSNIIWKAQRFFDFKNEADYFQEKLNFLLAYRDPKGAAKLMHTKLQFQALVHELTYAWHEIETEDSAWTMFVLRIGEFIGFMSMFLQQSGEMFGDPNPFQDMRQHLEKLREKCDRYKDYVKARNILTQVWKLFSGRDADLKIAQLSRD